MRGYGLPRHCGVEFPDVSDISTYGLKTSTGRVKDGRDDHGHCSTKNKKIARRHWKKKARATSIKDLRNIDYSS